MNVDLYITKDPPQKIKKTLANKLSFENVKFKDYDALNVITPRIVVKMTKPNSDTIRDIYDIVKFNYCHIPMLTRYYYITNISTEGSLVVFDLKCDVLMSFKNDILNSTQYITRSQTIINKYLVDPMLPIQSNSKYYTKVFGSPVSDTQCHHVILETIGTGGV